MPDARRSVTGSNRGQPNRISSEQRLSARLISFDQKRTELTPGTVLVREWDRALAAGNGDGRRFLPGMARPMTAHVAGSPDLGVLSVSLTSTRSSDPSHLFGLAC